MILSSPINQFPTNDLLINKSKKDSKKQTKSSIFDNQLINQSCPSSSQRYAILKMKINE
jgi:hypothetical protein